MRTIFMRSISLVLLLITAAQCFSAAPKKPWTFIVYMAADNNLNYFADLDLREMQAVGSNDTINIIVYLTIKRSGQQKLTQKLYINKDGIRVVENLPPQDSGNEHTLEQAVHWAITDFPSDHIAVVLWDHGSGPLNRFPTPIRGICYDDTTGNYLTDVSVQHVLNQAVSSLRGGKKIDIIAYDACLMAGIELAYAMRTCARYMVASQELEPGKGYDYKRALEPFLKQKLEPLAFAKQLVASYGQAYQATEEDYTLSAVDLDLIDAVVDNNNAIAHELTDLMFRNGDSVVSTISKSAQAARFFEEEDYIDLYNFYDKIDRLTRWFIRSEHLKELLQDGMRAVEHAILANTVSWSRKKARGISIYLPKNNIHSSYANTYWGSHTAWLGMVKAYIAKR